MLWYTPAANQSGTAAVTVTVADAGFDGILGTADDASFSRQFTVTVNALNDPPTVANSIRWIVENGSLALATGDFDGRFSDADTGDSLEAIKIVVLPAHGSLLLSGQAVSENQVILRADLGSLVYQPNADYSGTDSFTWKGFDGTAYSAGGAVVSIAVGAINNPPTLEAITDPPAIDEDAPQQTVSLSGITAGGGESQVLRVTAVSSNLALILDVSVSYTSPDSTGWLSYTPAANHSGTAVITVTVSDAGLDGILGSADDGFFTRQFMVTVNPVSDAPVVAASMKTVMEDAMLAFSAVDFTEHFNDMDPGDSLQVVRITALPVHGALVLAGQTVIQDQEIPVASLGNLTYQPDPDYCGEDLLSWKGSDGTQYSVDSAALTITVQAVNDWPTLGSITDPAAIDEDAGQQPIGLSGVTAGDGESQALQVTAVSSNPGLTDPLTINYMSPDSTGSLSYTPGANQNGIAVITVTVTDAGFDGQFGTADDASYSRQFVITVNPVNDPPTATPQTVSVLKNTATPLTLAADDGDAEASQSLTFEIVGNPGHGTISGFDPNSGAVTYVPATDYYGLAGLYRLFLAQSRNLRGSKELRRKQRMT